MTPEDKVEARKAEIRTRLGGLATTILTHEAIVESARAERLALYREGQGLEPKMTQRDLADSSRLTDEAVNAVLRKARIAEEKSAADLGKTTA